MGTWRGPHTKEEKEVLKQKLEQLLQIQDEIICIFGDDEVIDHFMIAEDRILWALDNEWPEPPGVDDGFQDFMKAKNLR